MSFIHVMDEDEELVLYLYGTSEGKESMRLHSQKLMNVYFPLFVLLVCVHVQSSSL